MTRAYYNENDPKAAAWLRELIRTGHIAAGDVDERSICDIRPDELTGYCQQHFFAGIGGWSYPLRLAGWPDDRPVRTGSCPCQPFSSAGRGRGENDPRHLWPVFRDLITFGGPTVTFGEQVASAAGRIWLDRVRADLEGLGYAVGAADLCAASVGSPQIRQRLFWMAHPDGRKSRNRRLQPGRQHGFVPQDGGAGRGLAHGIEQRRGEGGGQHGEVKSPRSRESESTVNGCAGVWLEHAESDGRQQWRSESSGRGAPCGCCPLDWSGEPEPWHPCGLVDANSPGSQSRGQAAETNGHGSSAVADGGPSDPGGGIRLGNAHQSGPQGRNEREHRTDERPAGTSSLGSWSAFDLIPCADGKARRVEPGTFPLAHGVSGRVGLLRGYGNAIVPQLAAEFIQACEEALT